MDNFQSNINEFEQILQRQSSKQPVNIYNKILKPTEQNYKPQDVIETVYSQVRAFQLADCGKSGKTALTGLNVEKKSQFLPLNKLPVYGPSKQEMPKVNPHKFETQCELDTQVMDIMDGVTIDANLGITQEFDTTFCHSDDDENKKFGEENEDLKVNSFILVSKENQTLERKSKSDMEINVVNQKSYDNGMTDQTYATVDKKDTFDNIVKSKINDLVASEQNSQFSKTAIEDTKTFIEDCLVTQERGDELQEDRSLEEKDMLNDTGQEILIPQSPVLNTRSTKTAKQRFKTLLPLVVSLETFETFEKIAMPVIENTDFETAKHVINSQILNKELCFNDDAEVLLLAERDKSPVFDFKTDELQVNSTDVKPSQKTDTMTDNRSEVLEDEILFSSDEEEPICKESQNCPFTCPLQVSDDEVDNLEKTLYVGFQTASHKSIQISRDSYEKAQHILSSEETKVNEEFSLTELVEKCDSLTPKFKNDLTKTKADRSPTKTVTVLPVSSDLKNILFREANDVCFNKHGINKIPRQQSFTGFMTASKKNINMSEESLKKCGKIFKDIDLDENFDEAISPKHDDFSCETNTGLDKDEDVSDNIKDVLLLEEFENTEMLLQNVENTDKTSEMLKQKKSQGVEIISVPTNIDLDIDMGSKIIKNNSRIEGKVNTVKDISEASTSSASFIGFKTASNKAIKISEEALTKSKEVFKDIGKDKYKIKNIEDIITPPSPSNVSFVGFQTASNKSIRISEQALSKSKHMFKDIDKNHTKTDISMEAIQPFTCKTVKKFDANNVCESETSNILNKECRQELIYDETEASYETQQVNVGGFETANNKSIGMSAESIEKSKKMFLDLDPINSKENNQNKNSQNVYRTPTFQGFQTASKKPVTVSASALATTKKLFQDIDELHETGKIYSNKIPEFMEFQTTRKKSEVSKDDLIASQKLLITTETPKQFVGFQTANNKKMHVSEEALATSKKNFQDIDKVNDHIQEMILKNKSSEFVVGQTTNENPVPTDNQAHLISQTYINDTNRPHVFVGFKTASNKNVSISDEALAKSKKMFHDIENINESISETNPRTEIPEFVGFKTANNKTVEVNKDSLIPSQKLLNRKHSPKPFIGFKTASNKKMHISEEALAKSKKMFQDIDNANDSIPETKQNTEIPEFTGFQTANKKTVKISKDAIIASQKLLNSKQSPELFIGFKTASNKKMHISEEALAKSKKIFQDIDNANDSIPEMKSRTEIPEFVGFKTANNKTVEVNKDSLIASQKLLNSQQSPKPFIGFKTASNKKMHISEEALAKSKKMFQDIDNVNDSIPDTKQKTDFPEFIGFQTANKKSVEVSKDAIIASQKLLNRKESPKPFIGFKTASNKKMHISEEALAKSKKMFQDIDNANDFIPEMKSTTEIPEFVGFQTTNNKTVEVNKDSLIASQKLINSKQSPKPFVGFKTASNKKMHISEEALAKSKKIFHDIDDVNDSIPEANPRTEIPEFVGFQTANNKTVEVNKDALIASQKLLNRNESPEPIIEFKTASNKKMHVSEKALTKIKTMFDDIGHTPIASKLLATADAEEEIFRGFQTENKKKIETADVGKTKDILKTDISYKVSKQSFTGFCTANNNKITISEEALFKGKQLLEEINTNTKIISLADDNIHDEIKESNFGLKNARHEEVTVSKESLSKAKILFTENVKKTEKILSKQTKSEDVNIEKILNTQVINDFDEEMCTEDFKDTRPSKRSGSPILICPKAKKRKKFETPYKLIPKTVKKPQENNEDAKPGNVVSFRNDYKKNQTYTLKDLADLEKDNKSQNIDPYILNFNLENILNFEFSEHRNYYKKGKMLTDDIKQIFTEATGKKLIPDGWLDIHLKLILWKLISYEIRFPNTLGKVCTVRNVIDQLKYRYDKELYNAERSVLRKILEKDDVPSKTMVLCVAGIYVDGVSVASATNVNNIELLLTDGWYIIKASIDQMLCKLVYDGKITVGSKIVTCGAELVNCEQGAAPWEDISAIRLSISGNSTRPALWHERLGLRPSSIVATLASVRVGGGKVARLRVRVTRVYPRLYVEKFQDGSTVTRSERLENQYQIKYEAERDAMIEKIYEEVEIEMADQDPQGSPSSEPTNKRRSLDSGSQIAKLMKTSKDPTEFRAQLTSTQVHLLQSHVSEQRDKYLQAIQDRIQERLQRRNVVTLARGRVVSLEKNGDNVTVTKGMLSIWKPSEDVLDVFREGSWIEITNVVPTAVRNSEIQLSAGRQSVFRPVKCNEDIFKPHLKSLSRICFSLKELSENPSMITDYNEIDTVGMVFAIDPSNRDFDSNKNQFQNVYLADADKNMICVNFWGGIKKFGYENTLDIGQIIYCGNLQKRAGNTKKNIPQFRATEFAIFTKTPKNVLGRNMVDEMSNSLFGLDRRKFCEDCDAVRQNYSVLKCFSDNENVTPYRLNKVDFSLTRNQMFIETPVGVKVKKDEFNLTGLDFESTFKQDTELSPKTLERKMKVNQRIARLKMYGEPPPLSHINIINKSKNATSSYKSPLLNSVDRTVSVTSASTCESVTTPKKLPHNNGKINVEEVISSSPIISNVNLNRTFVKGKPVKLNFCESVDRSVDHFAEEFDGSPPLSLE